MKTNLQTEHVLGTLSARQKGHLQIMQKKEEALRSRDFALPEEERDSHIFLVPSAGWKELNNNSSENLKKKLMTGLTQSRRQEVVAAQCCKSIPSP